MNRVLYLPEPVLKAWEAAEPSYFIKKQNTMNKLMNDQCGPYSLEGNEEAKKHPISIQEEAIGLIRYFVKRVEEGSIRSKVTYQMYKKFLDSLSQDNKGP